MQRVRGKKKIKKLSFSNGVNVTDGTRVRKPKQSNFDWLCDSRYWTARRSGRSVCAVYVCVFAPLRRVHATPPINLWWSVVKWFRAGSMRVPSRTLRRRNPYSVRNVIITPRLCSVYGPHLCAGARACARACVCMCVCARARDCASYFLIITKYNIKCIPSLACVICIHIWYYIHTQAVRNNIMPLYTIRVRNTRI